MNVRHVPLSRVRNIGIMAHINAGKTTLSERILFYSGINTFMGEVHEGTATMDWMTEERERGITITSAATVCPWRDCRINLIDTPGHVDFTAEVERSLRVLDGAVAVFCAVNGVQPQSETVWRQARKNGIPALGFVNKMDRPGADPLAVSRQIEQRLGITPLPLQLPVGAEDAFEGVIDLLAMQFLAFAGRCGSEVKRCSVPERYREPAQAARAHLIECLAEYDDIILERFLNEKAPSVPELVLAIRRATLSHNVMPLLYGSAFRNQGVQPLLDAVVDYLPSPQDIWEISGIAPDTGETVRRDMSDDAPFSALMFKTMSDRRFGRIAFLRVYSGTARQGLAVRNSRTGRLETFGPLVQIHANLCEERSAVFSGDIAAVVGLHDVATGDTLSDPSSPISLNPIVFPEPVVSIRVEPKTEQDRQPLHDALTALVHEDPSLALAADTETGQLSIAGMGELHLEIVRDRLRREYHLTPHFGVPRVAYRETVAARGEANQTFTKILGNGETQQATLDIEVAPGERGSGVRISLTDEMGAVPERFRQALLDSLRETGGAGIEHGYALTDIAVTVKRMIGNEKQCSEAALKYVASMALRKAVSQAGVCLLEPIMDLEVTTPSEYLGDVIGDLSSRRGRVTEVDTLRSESTRVMGQVPLAELFGYATALRSLTRGRADFVAEASHYERVPGTP